MLCDNTSAIAPPTDEDQYVDFDALSSSDDESDNDKESNMINRNVTKTQYLKERAFSIETLQVKRFPGRLRMFIDESYAFHFRTSNA
jgi:hypothetical protein